MSVVDDETLGSRKYWQGIAQTVAESEALKESTNRVSKAMYEAALEQDYIQRGVTARQLVEALGTEQTEGIVALIQEGKSPDEIASTLKKIVRPVPPI